MKQFIIFFCIILSLHTLYSQDLEDKSIKPYKGTYVMLGAGFGVSYGGFGIKAQGRYGGILGIGMHAGLGCDFEGFILSSIGIKFFPYKNIYLNIQHGGIGTAIIADNNQSKIVKVRANTFLIGCDWIWGEKIGQGINFAVGVGKHIPYGAQDDPNPLNIFIDLGYIIRF